MTATWATLTIVKDTWLTLTKSPSTELPDDQKRHVLKNDKFTVSYERDEDFIVFRVFLEHSTWFVSVSDVQIEDVGNSGGSFHLQSVGGETTPEPNRNPAVGPEAVGHNTTPEPKPKP